jgi:thiamine transporter ThiT
MQTQTLKLTKVKEIFFTAVFIGLAIYVPLAVHYFGGVNAGRAFLPMHFFVLVAGLLLGWRAGLITGLISPILSHLIIGMPMNNVLPFIIVELSGYGLVAGLLKEKAKLNIWVSLIGALVIGRLLTGIAVFLFSDEDAVNFVLNAAKSGLSGIALQLILVPVIVKGLYRYFQNIEQ